MSAWEHDFHDRLRDQERNERYEETAEEWAELEAIDRARRARESQGEEE